MDDNKDNLFCIIIVGIRDCVMRAVYYVINKEDGAQFPTEGNELITVIFEGSSLQIELNKLCSTIFSQEKVSSINLVSKEGSILIEEAAIKLGFTSSIAEDAKLIEIIYEDWKEVNNNGRYNKSII